jgi:hypothetical protein
LARQAKSFRLRQTSARQAAPPICWLTSNAAAGVCRDFWAGLLPDKRDEPVADALAVSGIAGQFTAQEMFLVEEPQNENGNDKDKGWHSGKRAERQGGGEASSGIVLIA